jgi:SHS2 domain-containing protein
MSIPYEEIEHTADWAIRVRGKDLAEILENAARGMIELAGLSPQQSPSHHTTLKLAATDRESLLVAWLEEILFRIESSRLMVTSFDLRISHDTHLEAHLTEVPIAAIYREIKAVTFHDLEIKQTANGFETTIVFDV